MIAKHKKVTDLRLKKAQSVQENRKKAEEDMTDEQLAENQSTSMEKSLMTSHIDPTKMQSKVNDIVEDLENGLVAKGLKRLG